jgi:type IV pilus assembly protein PilC
MNFTYKAVSHEGKTIKGIIEAKDTIEAGTYLRSRGILPITISPQSEQGIDKLLPFFNKTSSADLIFFTRQFASMLQSGLTLMQSLAILKEQIQKPAMKEIVVKIIADMEEGNSFSQSIAKYPETFTHVYVSLMKAAESSGLLDKVAEKLADNLEKQQKLKSTIKGALMYPAIIMIGMTGVMSVMMIFVIPQLSTIYDSLGITLPFTTQIIVNISNFSVHYWPIVLVILVLLIFGYLRISKTEAGKIVIDTVSLKLPVFGVLIQKTILAEFSRTLGLLVGSGTLVVEALNQSAEVVGNTLYRNAILDVSQRVQKGITVGDAMIAYPLFPPIMFQMVKIGEQTGKLDESLLKVSSYFEGEVEQATKTLTTALEPIILVVLGAGVGFLIISIITPIYNLVSNIK